MNAREPERDGAKTELDIPIAIDGEWVGSICFTDYQVESDWDPEGGRDADDGGGDGGGILEATATLGDTPADYRLEEPLHRQRVARDRTPLTAVIGLAQDRQPRRTVRRK